MELKTETKKITFLHVPKCGGTYIKRRLSTVNCINFNEVSRDYLTAINEIENSVSISIVRNPFDLLVSWWTSKHQKNGARGKLPTLHNTLGERHVNLDYSKDFKNFVVNFINGKNLPKDSYQFYQREFLFFQFFKETGDCGIDYIFKTEYLTKGVDLFLFDNKLKSKKVRADRTIDGKRPLGKNEERINVSRIGSETNYQNYYDDETIGIVKDKFRVELDMFGYDFGYDGDEFVDTNIIKYKPYIK